jgi:2,4-dienoyl-CoA reductase-like NADH-dependent reductase (Old Yellow Enzyme family)
MADENVVATWSYLTSELQKRHPDLAYLHFIEIRNTEDSLVPYRNIWKGPFMSAGYSNAEERAINIAENTGDLISFGRSFIANPDLPKRLLNGWELNAYDRHTFYTQESVGYTDYPFYDEKK